MRKNVELLTGFSNRYDVPEQMTISIGTVFQRVTRVISRLS